MERESSAEIHFLRPIIHPTPEQVGYFTLLAGVWDDVIEHGGATPEYATEQRRLILERIGMLRMPKPELPLDIA